MVEMEKSNCINFIVSGDFKRQIIKAFAVTAACTPQLWQNQSCLGTGHLDFWTLNCFHLYWKILVMENLTHYYMVKRNGKLEIRKYWNAIVCLHFLSPRPPSLSLLITCSSCHFLHLIFRCSNLSLPPLAWTGTDNTQHSGFLMRLA